MVTKTVLLFCNTNSQAANLAARLIHDGYRLQVVISMDELRLRLSDATPDLVLAELDSASAGCPWCAEVRNMTEAPILLLGAADQPDAVVAALSQGADLYLPQGTRPEVVAAYVATLMRRADMVPRVANTALTDRGRGYYRDSRLTIDSARRVVLVAEKPVSLTPTEFALLECLLDYADRPVTYDQLLAAVWGWDISDRSHIHTHIAHLRQKLGDDARDPAYIVTEYGIGYRFRCRS